MSTVIIIWYSTTSPPQHCTAYFLDKMFLCRYKNHMSVNNNNLIYWKSTKNFQDGCSAHIYGTHGVLVCLGLDLLLIWLIRSTKMQEAILTGMAVTWLCQEGRHVHYSHTNTCMFTAHSHVTGSTNPSSDALLSTNVTGTVLFWSKRQSFLAILCWSPTTTATLAWQVYASFLHSRAWRGLNSSRKSWIRIRVGMMCADAVYVFINSSWFSRPDGRSTLVYLNCQTQFAIVMKHITERLHDYLAILV
jgi:hypothetical protein